MRKGNVVKGILGVGIAVIAATSPVFVMPEAHATTMAQMELEIPMYDPQSGDFFLVENQAVANETMLQNGWIQVTTESLDTHKVDVVKKAVNGTIVTVGSDPYHPTAAASISAEQAVQLAYMCFIEDGYTQENADKFIKNVLDVIIADPDNYFGAVLAEESQHADIQFHTKVYFARYRNMSVDQALSQLKAKLLAYGLTEDQAKSQMEMQRSKFKHFCKK